MLLHSWSKTFLFVAAYVAEFAVTKEDPSLIVTLFVVLCLVHVIWTGCRMLKLVLNVKYLLLLSFLSAAKFYNLGCIQGIRRVA